MYLNFYGLREKPFEVVPDPRFLFLAEGHQETLARLLYAAMSNKGFLLLTGDVGTGKTVLLNALRDRLNSSFTTISISNPRLSTADLYRTLYYSLKFPVRYKSKALFLQNLQTHLRQRAAKGQRVLLVIDEAQALSPNLLEELRLLSNMETPKQKLLTIFLVGQPELRKRLARPDLRALYQRITIHCDLRPLAEKDTVMYIARRLRVAGAENPNLFNRKALKKIHRLTQGYPRLINILCDNVLLTGFAKGKRVVNHDTVSVCAREIGLDGNDASNQKYWSPSAGERSNRRPLFSFAFNKFRNILL